MINDYYCFLDCAEVGRATDELSLRRIYAAGRLADVRVGKLKARAMSDLDRTRIALKKVTGIDDSGRRPDQMDQSPAVGLREF
jgi:hypothetical protein